MAGKHWKWGVLECLSSSSSIDASMVLTWPANRSEELLLLLLLEAREGERRMMEGERLREKGGIVHVVST